MKLTSWLLRNLSNEDSKTDFLQYVLIASLLIFAVVATCATLTERIGMEMTTIASHL
jgi:hypothetical protein